MARMVQCVKLAREAEGLDFPPYPGELGKRLYENVSKQAWQAWLEHQKMLINLEEQMVNHFFGSGADRAAGYVPPAKP
jgi:Fe-S cluster biosynthesis and repair protein YggX